MHCMSAAQSASAAAPVMPWSFVNSWTVNVPLDPPEHVQPPPPQTAPPVHGIDDVIAPASSFAPPVIVQPPLQRLMYKVAAAPVAGAGPFTPSRTAGPGSARASVGTSNRNRTRLR